jgi:hypothetical protein
MKYWSAIALGATLVAFTPSYADDAAPAAADQTKPAAPAKDDGDEMLCRRAKLTGTNLFGPRICKSKKVWGSSNRRTC